MMMFGAVGIGFVAPADVAAILVYLVNGEMTVMVPLAFIVIDVGPV